MNYLRLPGLDSEVSVFDVCQAHQQLEADYNVGGWLRERPSNQRRRESTGCQLHRMQYHPGSRWVEICSDDDSQEDDGVREIYLRNVLAWGLPIDDDMKAFIRKRYTAKFLARYPQVNV
jgi:hypothetical protein